MPADRLFWKEFQSIVAAYPANVAIEYGGSPYLTYSELDRASRSLAARLVSLGAKPESFVGIELKPPDYIVAMLAVWYAGAAFVPYDRDLPAGRLLQIAEECNLTLRISEEDIRLASAYEPLSEPIAVTADTLAYAIFTSGSTGKPKGVLVTHCGIVNLLSAQIAAFRISAKSRSLFMLSTNFDASVSDIGCALLSGATLCIEPKERLEPGRDFVELIRDRAITHIDIPPSLLSLLPCEQMPDCVETLIIGGEVCPPPVVRQWSARFHLVNVYGPTEATVCSSLCVCNPHTWTRPLIGYPLPNVRYEIIDEELYIGGVGLARGYLNREELTEQKFVVMNGQRWYRTGDRVRQLPTGQIEFLGRIDRQVKVRGVLVEPEEIEARLSEHPAVARAAVVKRFYGGMSNKEGLVCFLQPKEGMPQPSVRDLREFVACALPKWMIPHRWEFMPMLPQTTSGKVDTTWLVNADLKESGNGSNDPFVAVVERVLGIDGACLEDNFFELGGDSFAVIELSLAAEALGMKLPPALIMAFPKLSALKIASENLSNQDASENAKAAGAMSADVLRREVLRLQSELQEELSKRKQNGAAPPTVPRSILLTGATGFLGSRLLYGLLEVTEGAVNCLVRCATVGEGLERIETALRTHKLQLTSQQRRRISVVSGDVSLPGFGLDETNWAALASNIDTIYHCAAQVNMVLPYEDLFAANVQGVYEVLRLMAAGRSKWLHYASTLSVFVGTDQNTGTALESDDLSDTRTVFGGYAQTKWAAEALLRAVGEKCGTVSYYRYGLIVGDLGTSIVPKNDFLAMFGKGIVALGCIPEIPAEIAVDITPVDFAAAATIDLSLRDMRENSAHTYHLANPEPLRLLELIASLRASGAEVDVVPAESFRRRISAAAAAGSLGSSESAACLALCRLSSSPATYERLRTMDLFQATGIRFDMANTLSRTTIRCGSAKDFRLEGCV